jgi:hypothetical protein
MTKQDLEIHESPAVIKHIEILQGIITRMAGNSAACKTWALTIVTGIIALFYNNEFPILLGIIPVVLFFALDSFYLGLESHFRDLHKEFVKKLKESKLVIDDIYSIKSKRSFLIHIKFVWYGMKSFSTLFFYPPVLAIIVVLFLCK